MNQPEVPSAAEAEAEENENSDDEVDEEFSLLDPEVEVPINAAVHFDETQAKEKD